MKVKQHQNPILTTDIAYLSLGEEGLQVFLMIRDKPPFKGTWTLPGGYIHCDKDRNIEESAARIIGDRSHIKPDYLEQIETIGNESRDPRGWSATILFLGLVDQLKAQEVELSNERKWVNVSQLHLLTLGFDHHHLLEKVLDRYVSKSRYTSLPLYLLPPTFSLTAAQSSFEESIGSTLEKKSFRRRLLSAGIIKDTGESIMSGKRNAALFSLNEDNTIYFFPRTIG